MKEKIKSKKEKRKIQFLLRHPFFLWLNKRDLVVVRNRDNDPLMEFLCSKFTSLERKKTLLLESTCWWLLIKKMISIEQCSFYD